MLTWLATALAGPAEVVIDVTDFGAIANDGRDDTAAFEAADDALQKAWRRHGGNPLQVLEVPKGTFDLHGGKKRGFLIDRSRYVLRCDPRGRTTLRGDPEGGKAERLIGIGTNDEIGDISDITIEHCAMIHDRGERDPKEQAHAIIVYADDDAWIRDVTLRDLTIGPVTSGDCVLLGRQTEQIVVERLTCTDAERNTISITGPGGPDAVRRSFTLTDITQRFTDPDRTFPYLGRLLDIEPSRFEDRVEDVRLERATGKGPVEAGGGELLAIDVHAGPWTLGGDVVIRGGTIHSGHVFTPEGHRAPGQRGWAIRTVRWPLRLRAHGVHIVVDEGGAGVISVRDVSSRTPVEDQIVDIKLDRRCTYELTQPKKQAFCDEAQFRVCDERIRAPSRP